MAIPEMTDDLEIIEKLSDRPNQGNALSSAELKALFDKGPKLIKQFINSIVIPALNRLDGAASFKGGHEELTGRDSADQHPLSAITGLVEALKAKAADKHNHNANEVNEGVLSTDRIPVVPVKKGGTGAETAEDARANLGITPQNIGALPAPDGRIAVPLVLTEGVNYGTAFTDKFLNEDPIGTVFGILAVSDDG